MSVQMNALAWKCPLTKLQVSFFSSARLVHSST